MKPGPFMTAPLSLALALACSACSGCSPTARGRRGDGDDTLVMLSVGGNDLNGDPQTVINRDRTEIDAAALVDAFDDLFAMLRARYQDAARGRALLVVGSNVYDPTDNTVHIPAEFTYRYCATIQAFSQPPYSSMVSEEEALANVAFFNGRIEEAVLANGGAFANYHAWFLGPPSHGMNSGPERWLDSDCTHPTDTGHHEMRRRYWQILTGEWL